MLIDGLSRQQLHALAIEALLQMPTLAGNRVFEFGDWPTRTDLFPMLLVSAQAERKVALCPGTLQFTTTITLIVIGRLVGNSPQTVGDQLEVLSEQILSAILFHPILQHSIQEWRVIETDSTVRSDGKQHIGEASAKFDVVVYQEYGPPGDPLTSIQTTASVVGGNAPITPVDPANPVTPVVVDPIFQFRIMPGPDVIY